jgi:hypothetical protein
MGKIVQFFSKVFTPAGFMDAQQLNDGLGEDISYL